jgi:hypothetical protein
MLFSAVPFLHNIDLIWLEILDIVDIRTSRARPGPTRNDEGVGAISCRANIEMPSAPTPQAIASCERFAFKSEVAPELSSTEELLFPKNALIPLCPIKTPRTGLHRI